MEFEIMQCRKSDSDYPIAMKSLRHMPERFYYKGDLSALNQYRAMAIVGSRNCSKRALDLAYEAGKMTAKHGMIVVNGLAIGCDTAALKGALSEGGRCAVILPGGLKYLYPRENINLASDILDSGGCVISEYLPEMRPQKHTFVERDRLQSGISQGVLIVSAEEKGGTMHTVDFAERQRKRIAVYASALINASGNKLLDQKETVTTISQLSDLDEFINQIFSEKIYYQSSLFEGLLE